MVVLPCGDSASEAVVTLTGQIDHMTGPDLVVAPDGGAAGNAQAPVQHHEGLAATGGAVDHHQGLVLHPTLDQP